MDNYTTTFGQFIAEIRNRTQITCQQLAKKIDISTGYLSQLEHGIRNHPDPTLVIKIAEALQLSRADEVHLYDLYAEETGQLQPDIVEYLRGNCAARYALRKARDANATEEDWERFIEKLKK